MALLSFTGSPHGGRQRLLPEWNSQPTITPTTIIDHSIVGSAEGAYLHFRDNTGIESHFIIDLSGEIWQLMDTGREADANLEANAYAISIETADNGDPDNFPWTLAQQESLVWLHTKLRAVHSSITNKEAVGCTSPGRKGHGYHTKNGAPSCWTPVAKTCPGNIRKTQWNGTMLAAYLEEDDLPYTEAQLIEIVYKGALDAIRRASNGDRASEASLWFNERKAEIQAIVAQLDDVNGTVAEHYRLAARGTGISGEFSPNHYMDSLRHLTREVRNIALQVSATLDEVSASATVEPERLPTTAP